MLRLWRVGAQRRSVVLLRQGLRIADGLQTSSNTYMQQVSGTSLQGFRPVGFLRPIAGFLHGLRHSSNMVALRPVPVARAIRGQDLQVLERRLIARLTLHGDGAPALSQGEAELSAMQILDWLLAWTMTLQCAAGLPVLERGLHKKQLSGEALLFVPVYSGAHEGGRQAFDYLLALLARAWRGQGFLDGVEELSALMNALRRLAPRAANTERYLKQAFKAGVPCELVSLETFQLGQGARARWIESTFTDQTSVLSARMARNKARAAELMRQAGLPVPAHAMVADVEAALEQASKLGYPVVVKPADLDGGQGVAACLLNADEVREAYAAARALSANVLVEKHVEGRDYRLTVMNGEMIWAVERVPAGVTGDGRLSVQALLALLNQDPRRSAGLRPPLKRVPMDAEALALLAREGLGPHSVLAAGRFFRLRRTANVASGGTPVAVFEDVHPDNRALALRAAAALRLDVAGVDLLIPDIRRSWRESGAAICEINAQPQVSLTTSPHIYDVMLKKLIAGNGRIPVVVVLGAPLNDEQVSRIGRLLQLGGLKPGLHDARGVSVGNEKVLDGSVNAFSAGRMLLRDRSVEAIVLSIQEASVLQTGLPFDQFDVLVLAGAQMTVGAQVSKTSSAQALHAVLQAILPCCTGEVLTINPMRLNLTSSRMVTPAKVHAPVAADNLAGVVLRTLLGVHSVEHTHSASAQA